MKIEAMLRDEIQSEFENLKKMETGTEKYKTTVDGLTKLVDRAIELEKFEEDCQDKIKNREIETEFKSKQFREEKKGRIVKNVLDGLAIVVPIGITIWGTCKTLEFEKTGTVTTIMGRGFINKLLPKK